MRLNKMSFPNIASILCVFVLFLSSCGDDDEGSTAQGNVSIEMTDAPIDDASIQGVFVTVTDVRVDGQSFVGFSGRQTFDLAALRNGNTRVLGTGELEARTYGNITFVLDYETDASGDSPGCYVLLANGDKQRLQSSAGATGEIVVNSAYEVSSSAQSRVIADFDLRKAVSYSDDTERDFEFISDDGLRSAIRISNHSQSGTIQGNYDGRTFANDGKVVVFAYARGTYNTSETQPGGEANVRFRNALNSAVVSRSSGNFTLAFLPAGEYELHFASFTDDDNDGRFTFNAMLESELQANGSVNDVITVEAESTIQLSATITGILN